VYRSLWLGDGDDLAAEVALQGSGGLMVEATLRRIVHAPGKGADGSGLPALVEYRLTGGWLVDRPASGQVHSYHSGPRAANLPARHPGDFLVAAGFPPG
jgi:hypothetical protein